MPNRRRRSWAGVANATISTGCFAARSAGVESEMELAYSGLHQRCGPFLDRASPGYPRPQREALEALLGTRVNPPTSEGPRMDEATARALIEDHFAASGISVAGGGPADDIARASQIYADDAVLEWPQGGERVRGRDSIIAFRSSYPARMSFEVHRITGCHDLWVNEYTIRYDDRPVMAVGIMQFDGGKVVRERIYFGEPWDPPAWRAEWTERYDPTAPDPRA